MSDQRKNDIVNVDIKNVDSVNSNIMNSDIMNSDIMNSGVMNSDVMNSNNRYSDAINLDVMSRDTRNQAIRNHDKNNDINNDMNSGNIVLHDTNNENIMIHNKTNQDIENINTSNYSAYDLHEIHRNHTNDYQEVINGSYRMNYDQLQEYNQGTINQRTINQGTINQGTINQRTINQGTINQVPLVAEVKNKKAPGRGKKFVKKVLALVSSAALFGVIAGAAFQGIQTLNYSKEKSPTSTIEKKPLGEFEEYDKDSNGIATEQTSSAVSTNAKITATDVSGVVENVMPAIVAINSTTTMTEYDFFGRKFENEVSGSGSGIIIGQSDEEILIVTNNHVVAGATAVEIEFVDETKAPATIKGTEPGSDLAVVAVNIKKLSKETQESIRVAILGDSHNVKTGEMAIAIGNALGYGQSVTVGYISALNREVTLDRNISLNLIQTDAAINPGNSGGALINARGEIIGINSVKYADTSVEGIGYAIPISEAVPIINELMNREDLNEEEMGYLGIEGKDVEESYANAFGMPVGIYISKIADDSAAQKAGLRKGDIIVGLNGKTLKTMQDLSNTLRYTRGGTTVTINLKVLENGEYIEKNIEVTLGYRNEIIE